MARLLRTCGLIIVLSIVVVLGATAFILFSGGPGAQQRTIVSTRSANETGLGEVEGSREVQSMVTVLIVTATPIPTTALPTTVMVFATSTPVSPTNTPLPPSATSLPPTFTPISPSVTPLPPTATRIQPSATPIPPSVTLIPPTSPAFVVSRFASPRTRYTHGTVNLRQGPDTSYGLVGSVALNTALQVVGQSGDWYLIRNNGREVFIAGWLTFDAPLAQSGGQQNTSGSPGFSCSPRKSCGQMSSCAEARFYLTQCQRGDLDRDSDGVPCESKCQAAIVQQPPKQAAPVQQPTQPAQQPAQSQAPAQPAYTCNCSKSCGAMSSCQEAYFQLNNCGCRRRDGNNDGVPCESICR